ncbi:MAG: TPM domain-containing protein, partial [Muribaculaceae bacterium]|nr:TPM domain-containing protein [Muribaculaceae bacterium]
MTRYISFIVLIFAAFIAKAYTVEQIPNVHIENRTRFVSNPDGILSASAQTQADSIISNIWQTSSAEVVAVIVNEIDGSDIDSFATNLFTHWGIGKKDNDNGLLILIVKDLRKAVIRTGYGIEGVVPDVVAGRIIRENMVPHF